MSQPPESLPSSATVPPAPTLPDTSSLSMLSPTTASIPAPSVKNIKNGYYCIQDYYAIGKSEYYHRLVMEQKLGRKLQPGECVDHIDRNRLNNDPSNLRIVTRSQNQQNRTKQANNKSGYKGVRHHTANRWVAEIGYQGRKHYLGLFTTAELAYEAYKSAAIRLHGEFAAL